METSGFIHVHTPRPPDPHEVYYWCPLCKRHWILDKGQRLVICATKHRAGECCHINETPINEERAGS